MKLSFEAKNFSQLKKIIFALLTKKPGNNKDIVRLKKIGNNILNRHIKKIRALV